MLSRWLYHSVLYDFGACLCFYNSVDNKRSPDDIWKAFAVAQREKKGQKFVRPGKDVVNLMNKSLNGAHW
jgi:hypothetical protein